MEDYQLEKFEQFYFGQMSGEEKAEFEKELQSDEDLKNGYATFILAKEAIEQGEAERLRSQMSEWDDAVVPPPNSGKPGSKKNRWALLVLFLVIVAIVYVSCPTFTNNSATGQADWDEFAEVQLRGIERSASTENITQRLNQMYLDHNYDGARQFLKNLEDTSRRQAEVELIDALLLYQEQNFEAARVKFESLASNDSIAFIVCDAAKYFSLLSKARMNECDSECMVKLKRLSEDENFIYRDQASLLIDRLRTTE